LFLPIDQLPEDTQPLFNLKGKTLKSPSNKHLYYDYGSKSIIFDLDWHCGITFYEKARDERGNVIGYKLGCDYMHYWDEGKTFTLGYVVNDAKHSIDKLWEKIPNLKLRCAWNGKYYSTDKVYYTDKGVCVALENKVAWEKPL